MSFRFILVAEEGVPSSCVAWLGALSTAAHVLFPRERRADAVQGPACSVVRRHRKHEPCHWGEVAVAFNGSS